MLYTKGLTTRQISSVIDDIYGFEVSDGIVSDITDKIMPQIEECQNRPLSEVHPIIFHFSVRDEHIVKKLAAYIILGINSDGYKEVLGITVGENESAKYGLGLLNSLKNREVKDILILCAYGLTAIKESISVAYPGTEYQSCIVHQVRNTLKRVSEKDKKAFANDLKTIYHEAYVRKVIYTTNAIESLNSVYRRLNNQKSVFSNTTVFMKSICPATY